MAQSARLALSARRFELRTLTIRVSGLDLTGAVMAMAIRLYPDTSGAPIVNLATVTTAAAEGLKLESVETIEGVPVSTISVRINKTTMSDTSGLGRVGEPGAALKYAYALQLDGTTRLIGDFWALPGVVDSDGAAPTGSFSSEDRAAPQPADSVLLTIAENEIVELNIDGADVVSAIAAQADEAATRAEVAAATIQATDINTSTGNAALPVTTTATGSSAHGYNALASLASGEENTALGHRSAVLLDGGIRNTFAGALAGFQSGNVNRVTAIGRAALIQNEGDDNTAVGANAGGKLTSDLATQNVFIGSSAGDGDDQKIDAVSVTVVGTGANATKNNQAVFGHPDTTETILRGDIRAGIGAARLAFIDGPNENYFLAGSGNQGVNGAGNICVGLNAGLGLASGLANTFVGKDAGKSVTTGNDHTFIGSGAGEFQVGGVGCTALGREAGFLSVNATNWTALGDTSLKNNDADSAVGVGYGCGRDQVDGLGFCGVGTYAGGYAASADRTTVMGTEALGGTGNNSYGDDNAVFGYRASGSTSGARNASFGSEAFLLGGAISDNTGFGYRAGFTITTGQGNTFVGARAGKNDAGQKPDVTNSIAIGQDTFTTKNNQTVIGNTASDEIVIHGVVFTKAQLQALLASVS